MKIAKPTDQKKIEELKKRINEAEYLEHAIAKLAQSLTEDLMHEE